MRTNPVIPSMLLALLLSAWTTSAEDDVDLLRQELKAMKAEYEQRIEALEKNLQALEEAPSDTRDPVAPPQDPELERRIGEIESNLERATLDLEFEGYLRSGWGSDGKGGAQSAFQAPNSGAKYRLGNETETYMEAAFISKTPSDQIPDDKLSFEAGIRLAYVTPNANNNDFDTETSLREAFARVGGVIDSDPGAQIWAGQRFYSRYDIHMNDFYYRDMSGAGGGLEGLTLGNDAVKVSLAWIGGSVDELRSNGVAFDDDTGRLSKNNIDVGLYDISVPGGTVALYGTWSSFKGDTIIDDEGQTVILGDSDGFAGSLIHDSHPTPYLHNRLAAQYGTGAAYNFRSQLLLPDVFDQPGLTEIDVDALRTWRVLNQLDLKGHGPWSLLSLVLFENNDYDTPQFDSLKWYSAGVRPAYHFADHLSLALEAGWDYTDQSNGLSGSVYKLTLAPQITPSPIAYSRPSLRAYFTYAWWDDEFVGSVGSPSFINDDEGLALGVQVEAWW